MLLSQELSRLDGYLELSTGWVAVKFEADSATGLVELVVTDA
jgi:hypothetical protein